VLALLEQLASFSSFVDARDDEITELPKKVSDDNIRIVPMWVAIVLRVSGQCDQLPILPVFDQ
jgi:hypothetical protein